MYIILSNYYLLLIITKYVSAKYLKFKIIIQFTFKGITTKRPIIYTI